MLTDQQLLDFDESRLADYDRTRALDALARFGDGFRFQLVAARHISGWADRTEEAIGTLLHSRSEDADRAFVSALREVAAHLRQCDYVPGGAFFEEEMRDG